MIGSSWHCAKKLVVAWVVIVVWITLFLSGGKCFKSKEIVRQHHLENPNRLGGSQIHAEHGSNGESKYSLLYHCAFFFLYRVGLEVPTVSPVWDQLHYFYLAASFCCDGLSSNLNSSRLLPAVLEFESVTVGAGLVLACDLCSFRNSFWCTDMDPWLWRSAQQQDSDGAVSLNIASFTFSCFYLSAPPNLIMWFST